jgi:hypothetical protein
MPYEGEQDTGGRRWEAAPLAGQSKWLTSAVNGVWLNPGEYVRWMWAHTSDGSYVCGYNIIQQTEVNQFEEDEKTEG